VNPDRLFAGARSVLVTPADDPDGLARALASPADCVAADLEDTVAPARKDEARQVAAQLLAAPADRMRLLRVNADPARLGADVELARTLALDALVVPKATPDLLSTVEWPFPVLAMIETAGGVRTAYEVARHPAVFALMLGTADLAADLGLVTRPDGAELTFARSSLVVDSRAAGLRPPFDGVYRGDADGLGAACALVRSLGMGGRACLDPVQAEPINRAFAR
jgi:citrate lyase subunit beta/citryl-CoA lyase